MTSASFDFDDRVIVRLTDRTRANGTAGRHGKVVGKSYEGDDPSRRILSYGVAMDEDDENVWMVEPDDLVRTVVWTDGSCNAKGVAGRGGWAVLIERDDSTEQLVGTARETTHNRMELTAVCEALERVNGAIEVRTDSTYIEKCFSEGWHIRWRRDDKWRTPKGPVRNRDLWERLFALVEDDARDVSFVWVKGHATEANNNIVDRLSREASEIAH